MIGDPARSVEMNDKCSQMIHCDTGLNHGSLRVCLVHYHRTLSTRFRLTLSTESESVATVVQMKGVGNCLLVGLVHSE
jgi:hypothetical protein